MRRWRLAFLFWCCAALGLPACSTVKPLPSKHRGLFAVLEGGGKPSRRPAQAELREEQEVLASQAKLRWPLEKVQVTSRFGRRNDGFHEGIDLRAADGTTVYSSGDGVVLYADKRIRGYGRMVVIKHTGGLTTVYAHNSRLLVKKGQKVQRGQKIAISGRSGRSRGPHLHFEVRDGVAAVDPERLIPVARASVPAAEQPEIRREKPRKVALKR
ncbi:MAG: M23 family metallopeptidase [Oligoflexia bacterium]|nr:M23 family metallopeptidase [Oligoflexia bacterium]